MYGISLVEYDALLLSQGNRCGICSTDFKDKLYPHVDHDHITSKVRGILCKSCNLGLGKLGDSINGIEKALNYLKGFE